MPKIKYNNSQTKLQNFGGATATAYSGLIFVANSDLDKKIEENKEVIIRRTMVISSQIWYS